MGPPFEVKLNNGGHDGSTSCARCRQLVNSARRFANVAFGEIWGIWGFVARLGFLMD